MKSITIAALINSLIIENIKLFNLRERISSTPDSELTELWDKIEALNNNRRLIKEDINDTISKYDIRENFVFVKTQDDSERVSSLTEKLTLTWLEYMQAWSPSKDPTLDK